MVGVFNRPIGCVVVFEGELFDLIYKLKKGMKELLLLRGVFLLRGNMVGLRDKLVVVGLKVCSPLQQLVFLG